MAAESSFPTFDWAISHHDKTATFEATTENFVIYRVDLSDDEVVTQTAGLFKNALLLVKNTSALVEKDEPHPFLKVEKTFLFKQGIELRFTAASLDTSFTLCLPEVKSSEVDLLMKRVQRIEQKMSAGSVAYEASATAACANGGVVQWKCLIADESRITHRVAGPTVNKAGTYQIIVSLVGMTATNSTYNSLMVGQKEVARGYNADSTNYLKQTNMMCVCKISAGENVSVIARFSSSTLKDDFANCLTLIKLS